VTTHNGNRTVSDPTTSANQNKFQINRLAQRQEASTDRPNNNGDEQDLKVIDDAMQILLLERNAANQSKCKQNVNRLHDLSNYLSDEISDIQSF